MYNSQFKMVDNYIYFYHLDKLILIPEYADSVTDNLSVSFNSTPIMTRTAPIFSYSYSGPREVQVAFQLHRDLMYDINKNITNADFEDGEDIVDVFIRYIQAAALPSYKDAEKLVNPPMVALRLGTDIFIKGVVQGGIGITYKYPIIYGRNKDGTPNKNQSRYSNIDVSFSIAEVDPYDADTIVKTGGFRGLSTTLERRVYSTLGRK